MRLPPHTHTTLKRRKKKRGNRRRRTKNKTKQKHLWVETQPRAPLHSKATRVISRSVANSSSYIDDSCIALDAVIFSSSFSSFLYIFYTYTRIFPFFTVFFRVRSFFFLLLLLLKRGYCFCFFVIIIIFYSLSKVFSISIFL